MGFLKKHIIILIIFSAFAGCAVSKIKIDAKPDLHPYDQFGRVAERVFYSPVSIGDSLNLLWESEIHGGFQNSSVSIYDEHVFASDLSGRVFAFDINSGKVTGQLKNNGAVFSTPLLVKYNVIYTVAVGDKNKSYLYFYDYTKSKFTVEKDLDGRTISEMMKDSTGLFFTTEDGRVYSYNFNGEKLWDYNSKSFTHSSPAMDNNNIVFGNDNGEIINVKKSDGKLVYRKKFTAPFLGGTAVSKNTAFIGNDKGELFAIDIKSGGIKWKKDTKHRITMTPAIYDGRIYIGNLQGELYCLNSENGNLIWQMSVDGIFDATPLITKNRIIQPDLEKSIHFIDAETGKLIRTYTFEGRVRLSPVFEKNKLFIGYDNGVIAVYEILN